MKGGKFFFKLLRFGGKAPRHFNCTRCYPPKINEQGAMRWNMNLLFIKRRMELSL